MLQKKPMDGLRGGGGVISFPMVFRANILTLKEYVYFIIIYAKCDDNKGVLDNDYVSSLFPQLEI